MTDSQTIETFFMDNAVRFTLHSAIQHVDTHLSKLEYIVMWKVWYGFRNFREHRNLVAHPDIITHITDIKVFKKNKIYGCICHVGALDKQFDVDDVNHHYRSYFMVSMDDCVGLNDMRRGFDSVEFCSMFTTSQNLLIQAPKCNIIFFDERTNKCQISFRNVNTTFDHTKNYYLYPCYRIKELCEERKHVNKLSNAAIKCRQNPLLLNILDDRLISTDGPLSSYLEFACADKASLRVWKNHSIALSSSHSVAMQKLARLFLLCLIGPPGCGKV